MKKGYVLYGFILLFVVFIWRACFHKTKEKYVLPNNYRGFFGVIYQANPALEKLEENNYRVFEISTQGVYESGFRSAKGTLHQEFLYENKEQINSFGFQMLGRLYLKTNESELNLIKSNQSELFAIWVQGAFVNGGENSVAIYFVGTGKELLHLLNKSKKLYFHLQDLNGGLQEDKVRLETYIFRLNQEYKEKKPPFD